MQCGGWTMQWQGCKGNDFTRGTTIWQAVSARCASATLLPAGATPSAKFPPSWIDQTMKKIEEFGEEVLAKFEEVTAKSKA